MKVYKLEVLIRDGGITSVSEAFEIIKDACYWNHIYLDAITCKEADIGEWDDDNPLNFDDTTEDEMNRLFPKE